MIIKVHFKDEKSFELIQNGISICKITSDCNTIGETIYLDNNITFKSNKKWLNHKYNILKDTEVIGSIKFNWMLDSIITVLENGVEKKYVLKISSLKQDLNLYSEDKTHLMHFKKTKGDFFNFEIQCDILNRQNKTTNEINEVIIYSFFPAFLIMYGSLVNQMNGGG